MKQELYFDCSSEEAGGSLYRIEQLNAADCFLYRHSTYNEATDETKVFQTSYASFEDFWKALLKEDAQWAFRHPLYVHPEVRDFIKNELKSVDWGVQGDVKWQASHQRQWTKVLSDNNQYYNPL